MNERRLDSGSTRVFSPRRVGLVAAGILAALVAVFHFQFLTGKSHLWEDLLYMAHPVANYLATSLADGRFPLWLSGVRDGVPFYSEPWIYYPPLLATSLFVSGGHLSSLSLQWFLVLHVLLGGSFMLLFLREHRLGLWACVVGTTVFTFSGFLSLHLIHGCLGHTFVWLPLELMLVKRMMDGRRYARNFIYLIAAVSMSFLAGFPQMALYNAYFLAAYWMFLYCGSNERKAAPWSWRAVGGVCLQGAKIGTVFIATAALGMVVILSTVKAWEMSPRERFGFAEITDMSLPWYYLLHGLVPNFFGMVTQDGSGVPFWGFNKDTLGFRTWHGGAWMYWEFAFYGGQIAIVAVSALTFNLRRLRAERREAVFFLGALLPLLLLMLGRYGGLFRLFYHVVPGFSLFRTPARIGGLLDFCLAFLAAVFVERLADKEKMPAVRWPLAGIAVLYGLLIVAVMTVGKRVLPDLEQPEVWSNAVRQTMLSAGIFGAMAGLILLARRVRAGWPGSACVAALGLVAFLDFYWAFHAFHQGRVNPEDYFADKDGLIARMTEARNRNGPFRFAQLRDAKISQEIIFPRNTGYFHPGYEAPEGYVLFTMKEMDAFHTITNDQVQLDIQNVGVVANADSRRKRLAVSQYASALPRVKLYHAVRPYEETDTMYRDLESGRLDYRRVLGVLQTDCERYALPTSAVPADAQADARITPKTPESYEIAYRTTAPGVIFVSESFYPDWEADDGQLPMIRAFGAFKGIVISKPGEGVVRVSFKPRPLRLGLAISGASLILLLFALVATMRRDGGSSTESGPSTDGITR